MNKLTPPQRRMLARGGEGPVTPHKAEWVVVNTLKQNGLMRYTDYTLRHVETTGSGRVALEDAERWR